MKLISTQDLINATHMKGIGTRSAARFLMSVLKLNRINDIYARHNDKEGVEFVDAILDETGITYSVTEADIDRVPKTGAFIIVANHPYGGIEGLILIKALQSVRPDLKIIGNFLFHKIAPIKVYIFPVNPFENLKDARSSLLGLKEALVHLEAGNPLLLFPAGEVSTYNPEYEGIADKKWSNSAIKFIKKARVPVIPVFFKGSNSVAFHLLGLIHPLLRTAMLPSEMLNKRKQVIQFRIGNPVLVKEQDTIKDIARYGRYLRAKTYSLESTIAVKKFFHKNFKKNSEVMTVEPVEKMLLLYDVINLKPDYYLFSYKNFEVFCAPSVALPNILTEIGRLREITFREIGEGTNRKIDIDEYDLYYNHLFIWDNETSCIVGAYRLGKGLDIMEQYGSKGFYTRSLFKYSKEFHPILYESIELGRSFIVKEYQKNPHALYLLWIGIFYFLLRNPDYRYLLGPVSISNKFSEVSKSLIIEYIQANHMHPDLSKLVQPRTRYKPSLPNFDTSILAESATSLNDLDKVISDIEWDNSKVPVLLKKYLQLNGKIICFNLDPLFNDALDGLLLLDFFDVPGETIGYLSKELQSESVLYHVTKTPIVKQGLT